MTLFGSKRLRCQDDTRNDQKDWPKLDKTEARVLTDQEKHSDRDDHQRTHQAANLTVQAVARRLIWIAHLYSSLDSSLGIPVQTIPKNPSADQDQRYRPAFGKPLALQQPKVREEPHTANANQQDGADRPTLWSRH